VQDQRLKENQEESPDVTMRMRKLEMQLIDQRAEMQRVVQTLLEEVPSKIDREIKRLQSIEQETAKDTSTGIRKNHEQIQSFHQILNSTSD